MELHIIGAVSALLVMAGPSLTSGDRAPALRGLTLDGHPAEVALGGRVTLVDFFATWCPRCRESTGVHQALLREFGDRLQIVVVDVGERAALVGNYFAAHPLPRGTMLLLDPEGSTMAQFGPRSFPSFFVIDEGGIVRGVTRGWGEHSAEKLAARLRALLAPPAQRLSGKGAPRRKARPVARAGISADEHARRMGVEVLR